jgi:hypothetical protein
MIAHKRSRAYYCKQCCLDRIAELNMRDINRRDRTCWACFGTGFESTDPEDSSPCIRCNGTGKLEA